MSKISLKPNASGTGVFSLEAPNSNVDRTLNLPDEAGTVLTNVSDIESQVKTATNATGSAPVYACRAWVNMDGTDFASNGNTTIRGSGNVSSVQIFTARYITRFITDMPDTNYSIAGSCESDDTNNSLIFGVYPGSISTSQLEVMPTDPTAGGRVETSPTICVSIFR